MSREVPYYEYDSNHLRVARIHSAFSFPAHLHAQVELTCCLAGQIQMDIGAQAYTLAQGDIAIIFPSVAHRYAAAQGQAAVGTMLIFYPAFLPDFSRLFAQRTPTCPVVRAAQCAGDAAYALAALHQELEAGGDDVAIRALTTLLLCRTLPHTHLVAAQGTDAHDTLHRAMQYLSERFTGPVTLSQTARDIGVSPCHLSRSFHRALAPAFAPTSTPCASTRPSCT